MSGALPLDLPFPPQLHRGGMGQLGNRSWYVEVEILGVVVEKVMRVVVDKEEVR